MGLPTEKPQGLDSPLTAKVIKYGARANVAIFRATNGRVGGTWRVGAGWRKPVPVLLLDHVGRRSGKRFTTPLLFLQDSDGQDSDGQDSDGANGERLVIVASQGGLPKHPQWFHNLRSQPDTEVHVPRKGRHRVRARVADEAERAALWPRLVDLYADFDSYAAWTDREIPVVVLDPRG